MAVKVLLIEDDQLIQRMYEKIFKFEKFDVEIASDGEEGLEKARTMQPKPTIILLDVMMPKMNGLELLDLLKKDDNYKNIPVIIITNLANDKENKEALSKGADSYIIKSNHEPKELIEIAKAVLARNNLTNAN